MIVLRYKKEHKIIWDNFIKESNNGTFLFMRDYLEYHSDRFLDFSLLVLDEKKNIIAVFPANLDNDIIYSHNGLTYGGIVTKDCKLDKTIKIFDTVILFLKSQSIKKMIYKSVPNIYLKSFTDSEKYAIFLNKGKAIRVDTSLVIDLKNEIKFNSNRKRSLKKAQKNNLQIERSAGGILFFWNEILTPNLKEKYFKSPVHSLEEIQYLQNLFPDNILQYNVYLDDEILGGTTLFLINDTIHSQYIASNEKGRRIGCLDYLFDELITEFKQKKMNYFSFGIVNENDGLYVNQGLLDWKESFGAKVFCNDFFEFNLK
tara:strand:- start:3055 stop:3999 length:945 start_codon:yes stop_codon:yes gene_type:complete